MQYRTCLHLERAHTREQGRSAYYNGSPSALYKLNTMVNIHLVVEDQMVDLQSSLHVSSATRCFKICNCCNEGDMNDK